MDHGKISLNRIWMNQIYSHKFIGFIYKFYITIFNQKLKAVKDIPRDIHTQNLQVCINSDFFWQILEVCEPNIIWRVAKFCLAISWVRNVEEKIGQRKGYSR